MTTAATSTRAAPPAGAGGANKLSDKTLKERQFRWDKLISWLAAGVLLVAVVALWGLSRFVLNTPDKGGTGGGTVVGYTLGILTVVLYAGVAAYSMRHRRRRQELAMTRVWMEAHLAFGVVAGVSAFLHAGPKLGAPMHGAFLAAWLLLIGTGILGKFVSVWAPRRLTRIEDEALLVEDVVARQAAMRLEIEQLLQDATDEQTRLVNDVIPAHIKAPDWYGRRRMKRVDVIDEVYKAIDGDAKVPADKRDWLKRMVTCVVEERFLGRMLVYHYVLRGWLPIHVALTTLCFPWLIFHVVTVFLF